MNFKRLLLNRHALNSLSRLKNRRFNRHFATAIAAVSASASSSSGGARLYTFIGRNSDYPIPFLCFGRYFHSAAPRTKVGGGLSLNPMMDSKVGEDGDDDDGDTMNEFLSRFVWIMRGKISEAYPDCDKETVKGMLLIIVEKVVSEMEKGGGLSQTLGAGGATRESDDFSEDLWRTVWEVGNTVVEDMENERRKEKMKGFLQCEEVQEMCRFAGEIGIRGDMLRELRFKWAREKMEEREFYESLERLREEGKAREREEAQAKNAVNIGEEEAVVAEEKSEAVSLPKRHGKIKYKIYGLDLSDPKWADVADRVHDAEEAIWPQESKPITGKCKLVTEKILSLKEDDDPSPLLAEWMELLQPSRIDWITLLDQLKKENARLYFKIAEQLLSENSFQANIRDYSALIDSYAKEKHVEDAERILKKMTENGIVPDILTATTLVHMYSKVGNLDRAKEAFESLRSHGFKSDFNIYNAMVMAYLNGNQPKLAESVVRDMELKDIKPTEEIYMALLRSFAQLGDIKGATRIANTMQFAGFQPNSESCTLLVEAYSQAGDSEQARANFDYMIKVGYKPDDRCTASMIAAYGKRNLFDKALSLLLQLEKDGFELGPATCAVLVDWFGRMELVDEAEQLVDKIAAQGEAPPVKIQVSLCDMYARAGMEKKTLQALGILEAKKEQLGSDDFDRVIHGLLRGGFGQDAQRMKSLMEARGFTPSKELEMDFLGFKLSPGQRPTKM